MSAIDCARRAALTMVLLATGACERETTAVSTALAPEPEPPVAKPDAIAQETESSLTLKRGTITLTTDARELRFCGEQAAVWVVQQEDLTLDETYARLAGESGTPLYVELRGERIAAPAGTSVPERYAQAFLLEELLYASVPGEGGGCAVAAPTYRVLARGNEPFWAVEVTADSLLLRQSGQSRALVFSQSETQDVEGTVTFKGAQGEQTLELTIASAACSDSMSGEYFAFSAEARFEGRTYSGCARLGE